MANPRIEDLRRRLEREPGSRLFAQLAEELRKEGDLEEAIRVARDGLQKHPAYPSARMTLGRALLDKGDLAPARSEFESVLKGAPDNILGSRFLAECLEGLGELEAAASRYKSTLVLAPGDRQVQSRLEGVEAKLRRRGGAGLGPGGEPRPVALAQVDEPMVLEAAHEGPAVSTGAAPSFDLPAAPAAPVAEVEEESFEVVRSEPPTQSQWAPDAYVPAGEAVFDDEDVAAATLPPGVAMAPFEEPPVLSVRTVEMPTGLPSVPASFVEPEPVETETVEPLPEPVPEPELMVPDEPTAAAAQVEPPLVSPTLAELYFNQGFTDRAIEVYRQVLEREPLNERAQARLIELEALDRHLRGEALPSPAPARAAASPPPEERDPRARRRQAIERTIARLEGFLATVRRG